MKERPILMSTLMVKAILDGRKTQTRRVITKKSAKIMNGKSYVWERETPEGCIWRGLICPYGQVGDRLWVRETWCPVDDTEFGGEKWVDYRATPWDSAVHPAGWQNAPDDADALKWRPSIFMPRWASRITLEITDIRVQRVQEIREEDAFDEGMDEHICVHMGYSLINYSKDDGRYYKHIFKLLWDYINGKKYPWSSNPWVWAITFKQVSKQSTEDNSYIFSEKELKKV